MGRFWRDINSLKANVEKITSLAAQTQTKMLLIAL